MEFLTVVVSVRKIGENDRVALHVRFAFLCERLGDFGKREREPGESLGKLGDFGRERESAWRITRKHWKELERKWAGWQGAA